MWETTWEPLVFDYVRMSDRLLAMVYVHDVRWKVSTYVRDFLANIRAEGLPVRFATYLMNPPKLGGSS